MTEPPPRRLARTALFYALLIGVTVAGFIGVNALGDSLAPSVSSAAPNAAAPAVPPKLDALPHVLLALAAIVVVSRILGWLFRKIHQPRVIGEVIAGILLGPSLLGALAPEASAAILPPAVAPYLNVVAQVGVILFMFLVGLELDAGLLRSRTHATIAISHASIVVPFLLGSALALWLFPSLAPPGVPFHIFALFMGVSMSVTAFPVLARILTDRGMQSTRLGAMALTCAAVDDVTAWCLLAYVVSIVNGQETGVARTIGLVIAYAGVMLLVVRPILRRLADSAATRELRQGMLALVLVGVLASALVTEWIGIHAIFGAFLFGAVIPHDSPLARQVRSKIEDLAVVLLLPAFFAYTGMRTQIGLVSGWSAWLVCGAIVVVACVGKFGGSYVAARVTGVASREAAALGVLMNTRGLMELVVLNIGLDLGVLSPTLFAMLVIMAVVTTFATTPLLTWIEPSAAGCPEAEAAARAAAASSSEAKTASG